MDWISGMQKALDYIESHLTEDIDYEKVAKESFSSAFHFQRVFSILCGYTVGEYVRLRRLSLAGAELASGNSKVIDVALKYGYDSPDSFSKAFQKFHGITPSNARTHGKMLKSFSRLSIKISLEGGSTMNYKIEEKDSFYVMEKVERHSTENGENLKSIPNFWNRAEEDGTIDKLKGVSLGDGYTFGICYGGASEDKSFDYSIAVRCAEDAEVPCGFRKNRIDAKRWLIFDCTGPMPDAIQDTWSRIVSEFLPTSAYKPTYEMDIEAYSDGDVSCEDYRSEIWLPIKK